MRTVLAALFLCLLSTNIIADTTDTQAVSKEAQAEAKADKKAEKKAEKKARKEAKKAKKNKQAKDRRVCKRQKVTGSRIPEKVCRKESEWARIQERARENLERSKEGRNRAVGTSGES